MWIYGHGKQKTLINIQLQWNLSSEQNVKRWPEGLVWKIETKAATLALCWHSMVTIFKWPAAAANPSAVKPSCDCASTWKGHTSNPEGVSYWERSLATASAPRTSTPNLSSVVEQQRHHFPVAQVSVDAQQGGVAQDVGAAVHVGAARYQQPGHLRAETRSVTSLERRDCRRAGAAVFPNLPWCWGCRGFAARRGRGSAAACCKRATAPARRRRRPPASCSGPGTESRYVSELVMQGNRRAQTDRQHCNTSSAGEERLINNRKRGKQKSNCSGLSDLHS